MEPWDRQAATFQKSQHGAEGELSGAFVSSCLIGFEGVWWKLYEDHLTGWSAREQEAIVATVRSLSGDRLQGAGQLCIPLRLEILTDDREQLLEARGGLHLRLVAETGRDMLTGVRGAFVYSADVVVVTVLVVNTAAVHRLVDAVAVGAMGDLANLRFTVIRAGAAVLLLFVLAASLFGPRQDFADIKRANLAIVAHAVGGTAVLGEGVLALVIRGADVVGAGVAVIAVAIDETTTRSRCVVAELIGTTLVRADVDDAVLALAGGRYSRQVNLARCPGDGVDAVSAVGVLLAAASGDDLPVAKAILAGVNGARIAVVANQLSSIRSTTFGTNR